MTTTDAYVDPSPFILPDPVPCILCRDWEGRMAPSHDGSTRCESGSIASGGSRDHCSCDTCF